MRRKRAAVQTKQADDTWADETEERVEGLEVQNKRLRESCLDLQHRLDAMTSAFEKACEKLGKITVLNDLQLVPLETYNELKNKAGV